MSDSWLQYIPTDPKFLPTAVAVKEAEKLLATYAPDAEEVRSEFHSAVRFFHPGANWSGVVCPTCGADAESWWSDAMDLAAGTQFESLSLVTACCGAQTSLNELRYVWPAGFASFVLEVMNPNIARISAEQLRQLSFSLGCPLMEIPVHI